MTKIDVTQLTKIGKGILSDSKKEKSFESEDCNFLFFKDTGQMITWGASVSDDPDYAPFPFILDIEITTKCKGPAGKLCGFCYKSNNPKGTNMTFKQFKNIIDKMPWLTQIALGADAQGKANPEMFMMMAYARKKGIIPNITIADVSEKIAGKLAKVSGAVAVSVYKHAGFDVAFDSVKRLIDAGQKQVNLHYMLSSKTLEGAYEVVEAMKTDPRLQGLNAIVFLGLKQKGRGVKYDTVSPDLYKELVEKCLADQIPFGFDSCSAPAFIESVKSHESYSLFKQMAEDCESTLFSSYINEKGDFYPCSFTEGELGWETGLSVLECKDFIEEIWNHERTTTFRKALIQNKDDNGCRNCPVHVVCGIDKRVGVLNVKTVS